MHTREVWKLGKKYVPHFRGVYPLDKMPKSLVAPSNIVINTHTHNLPGEHWLAVSYQKSGLIYAFDFFGLYYPTLLQNYLQRLKRRSGPVKYNRTQFQEVHEKTCGHYCIAYLTYINT